MSARARERAPQSLGAKLLIILTGVGLAGALAITLLLVVVITPSFNTLEARSVEAHTERTRAALADYASKVESAVRDYGDWNASYDYMAHPTAAFEAESFSPLAMSNLGVQGMAYVAPDGRVLIARWLGDEAAQKGMRADFAEWIAKHDLTRTLAGRRSGGWFARLGGRAVAIGAAQVRRSDGTGAPRGHVLMARTVTSDAISALLQVRAAIDLSSAPAHPRSTRRMLEIAVPMTGPDGEQVATARFGIPREVSVLGRRMLLLAVAGSILLLLLVLSVLRRTIARMVLEPIGRIERHMQLVRVSGTLAALAEDGRRDEIGSLGRSFNAMLSQLKDLREQIEAQSFQLGRSESAVAVMHNVRNALNPVSTILSQGAGQAAPVDPTTVARALGELSREELDHERRRKLAAFVEATLAAEARAREAQARELQVGREAMVHALEIIGEQQKQAHERPLLERCDVGEIVARNAAIARYSTALDVRFSWPGAPCWVQANRVLLSQVVGNLLGNAAEAIAATGRNAGAIAVEAHEHGGRVELRVRDDGEGFDPEVGATLFRRGFSTRAHKSGGLGLHWCANAMTAMDGSLRLESEGRGRGATAVLTLRAADDLRAAA